nr:non-structural movement protein NSm [Pterostylis blotch virus]
MDALNTVTSKIGNIVQRMVTDSPKKDEQQDWSDFIKSDGSGSMYLSNNVNNSQIKQINKNSMKVDNGKQIFNTKSTSILGTYEDTTIDQSEDIEMNDLLSRMVVDKSMHLSNWKNDMLVGNNSELINKKIHLNPTWNSKKMYLMLSRIIVWVCPTAPNTNGKLKLAIVDPNKIEDSEKVILVGESVLVDPVCFIFSLNWSYHKENNIPGKCPQLHILSNEKYKKGSSFAAIMHSWTKEFCDSPRADEVSICQVVPISRAIRVQSKALIEACKLIIPKGSHGKQIQKQVLDLTKYLEQAAKDEEDISDSSNKVNIDFGKNEIDLSL